MKTIYYIRATSPTDRFVILAAFIAKGFVWHRAITNERTTDIATIEQKWPFDRWPLVNVNFEKQELGGNGGNFPVNTSTLNEVLDAWEAYQKLPKPVKIKLNSSYTALVTADTIEVGCQKFPITIIDKLVKARDSFDKPTTEATSGI